ncbi:MAG: YgaP family membrane protein [Roseiflexus sp.]
MFTKNEGPLDRGIRAVFGALALVVGFTMLSGLWQIVAGVVGLMLLVTAAIGICPLYSVLGVNTCPVKPAERR